MIDTKAIDENRGVAKRSFTASTAEGLTSCDVSSISGTRSSIANDTVDPGFLNKRRRQWMRSSETIRCFEDQNYQEMEMDSELMFIVMRIVGSATEPIIVGASQNYIKELEYFRDEIVGYPVSHFLSKSQPEEPIWIDCLNWNLVYRRERGREFHVAQAGAQFQIGSDTLILGCATPVTKVLGQLDLTIHRKLKAIARKMTSNAEVYNWACTEYAQYAKEDAILFPNRSQQPGYQVRNSFIQTHNRRQSLSNILAKSSLSCLDLSISENKAVNHGDGSEVENTWLKTAQAYDDIEALQDPADFDVSKHPNTRPKNLGSICHPSCKKACQFFFFSYKGCNRGFQCDFCHEGHVSNRKAKAKAWIDKQSERARQKEESSRQWGPYQNGSAYWPTQNDALMGYGLQPVVVVQEPPVHVQNCTACTNCGCGQILPAARQTLLMPRTQPWQAWQPEYIAMPSQWQAPPPVQWDPQWEMTPKWYISPRSSQPSNECEHDYAPQYGQGAYALQ